MIHCIAFDVLYVCFLFSYILENNTQRGKRERERERERES
jgi:hypothetical protein